jgi:ABC-type glycerol-3-phosphate transport system substrate-binding protein
MASSKIARRRFVAGTAMASAAFVAAPFVRGAYAAGKLTLALWDHWVPNANNATKALIDEWAAKEKVEVNIDFITSQGNKLLLTGAAEAQAKSGHDIFAFSTWLPSRYADQLVSVNDIMEPLIKQNGAVNGTVEYLGKVDGKWLGVPATVGSQIKGPCSRIDLMKDLAGIDVQEMYPAGAPAKADAWTFDTFLKAAEACHKGGHAFGIGLGTTSDNVDTAGMIFHGFGAMLVDAKGNMTVKSDAVRQALDYYKRLMAFLPSDVPSWDDASNNKWLVSGKGALIMNPPSAWAVAKRDAPKGRRAAVDPWLPRWTEGPLCAVRALLLEHLEFQQEPGGGQEPDRPSFPTVVGGEDGRGEQRLRPALVREAHDLQDLGRGGSAQGHALPLSEHQQSPDPVARRRPGAAQDR